MITLDTHRITNTSNRKVRFGYGRKRLRIGANESVVIDIRKDRLLRKTLNIMKKLHSDYLIVEELNLQEIEK